MISKIVSFCLQKRFLTLFLGIVLLVAGGISFNRLPIEAYPDVADTWVQVITQWPGHAAEEVEKQITIPIEIQMNSVPHHTYIRSTSLFGLSVVTMLFDEKTNAFTARQYVLEKLSRAETPDGAKPVLGPMFSPVGQVYFYTLDSKRPVQELKEIQDWELEKRLKSVDGVAEVSSFGGLTKQYQIQLDPLAISNYNITINEVVDAVQRNNKNGGGGLINRGDQGFYIRGIGKTEGVIDLENIIVTQHNGTPIRIKNIARVIVGSQNRLGKMSMAEKKPDGTVEYRDDVVVGIIFSRVGEDDEAVLKNVHKKVDELNEKFLPSDVKIKPYLDRSNLIKVTSHTVEKNMVEGMLLVLVVLLFFLGNLKSALIVAVTIPFSLLFASILLEIKDIPANLLSLGALDFGMVVDGAVVMVENIFRHKHEQKLKGIDAKDENIIDLIKVAASEVERPIVFAIAIIILSYLPIFMLERVEGKLFSPMAWTVGFALLGSMIIVLTIIPVLCSFFLKGELKEWHNPIMEWVDRKYKETLIKSFEKRNLLMVGSLVSFALTIFLAFGGPIGSEFLPHLDEGSIWVRGTLPASASFDLATDVVTKAKKVFISFPEVPLTVCQLGRSDDGYDATGFFNTECYVNLKAHKEWRKQFKTKDQLIEAFKLQLSNIPGVIWNFSQPISDNVEEMMSGVKGALVVKIYGNDLHTLTKKANEVKGHLGTVKGVEDLGVFQELGQPNINIKINRETIARYGLDITDVQDVIETAMGGKIASEMIDGEKRFEISVRYQPQYRGDVNNIKRVLVSTPEGFKVPLEHLAEIKIEEGASMIYREDNVRYIA
jgi:cobalt-zinc-cadmium resistance protein CzcA